MIVWEISIGSLLTVLSVLFVGAGFYWKTVIDNKQFKEDIHDIKGDLKLLNKIITDVAIQNQRLDTHGEWLNRLNGYIDELRHGIGFILDQDKKSQS